ncbi:MAG: protein kinase [Myxococcales bacterium]|nr:protein kinase [Myxococcales bacterium]MCB9644146.1 protein kinase [Myxococcales bacterium]
METLGKYRLIRRVAVGGMAEIFLAEQPGPAGFSRRVAIKRILPHRADDAEFVEMFLNEAKLAAMLNHPNIVQIYDLGQINQTYYIAMEFVEGYDLGQILDQVESKGEQTPPLYAAHIIGQAAAGLHYAHQYLDPQTQAPLGLIHRDISLPNVMVSTEGIAKILDFGIAKARISGEEARKQTQTGVLKGKISYMSPEYLMGDPIDWRHDLFALGVVLYELITGQKPFKARGDVQMLQAILTQEPTDPREYHSSLPDPLISIMMKMLAKEPNERFQHGAEIEHAVEQCIITCTGGEISQFYLSEFLRTLFSETPTHAPEPTRTVHASSLSNATTDATPIRPPVAATSNAPAFQNASPTGNNLTFQSASPTGDVPAFQPTDATGEFVPLPDPNDPMLANGPQEPQNTEIPGLQPITKNQNPWMEETRSISLDQIKNPAALLPHFPEPTPTAALVLRPEQNLKSMSIDEIAALQPGVEEPPPAAPPSDPSVPSMPIPLAPIEQTPNKELPTWIYIVLPFLIVLLLGLVMILWRIRSQKQTRPTPPITADAGPSKRTVEANTKQAIPPANRPDAGPVDPVKRPQPRDPQIEIGEARPIPDLDPSKQPDDALPPGDATLLITASRPCPCTLYLRGRSFRVSGKILKLPLEEGQHNMVLRRKNPYIHLPIRVNIKKGETQRKHISIREGYLAIVVTPWSSKVYIDSNYIGTTPLRPLRLYQGYHQLRIDNLEHLNRPIKKMIYIRPNTQLPIKIRIR